MAKDEEIRLPDTNTLLTIRYTYGGQEKTLAIQGENAEHGDYMLRRFQAFLEGIGFDFSHLKPPLTVTKVARSAAVMLVASGLSMLTPPVFAIGTGNKPRDLVIAEVITPHVITAF